jgi:cytosine/adenosine deaminase-related metal-dependent hydrolase
MTDGVFRAAWVLPMTGPPLQDAWVAVRGGRIAALGRGAFDPGLLGGRSFRAGAGAEAPASTWTAPGSSFAKAPEDRSAERGGPLPEIDLGSVALMPGLINAHTHLELSGFRSRVPPSPSLPRWVRTLMQARARGDDPAAVAGALDEAIRLGTAALADVSNSLASVATLAKCGLPAVVFHELLGFDPDQAESRFDAGLERLRAAVPGPHSRLRLAAHAPYSTSASLMERVMAYARSSAWPPTTIHVAESADEVEFLTSGTGEWSRLLDDLDIARRGWRAPGVSPVRYLDALGVWQPGTLAVHAVHLWAGDLDMLVERDVTIVTCPRSNEWVGAGIPPVGRFVTSGARMAIGTDSLASAPDLSLFEELRRLRVWDPEVPARTLLRWATCNGAVALGLDDELGTLAPGRRARVLAVQMPPGISDVEDRLVSGVSPEAVRWLEDLHVDALD